VICLIAARLVNIYNDITCNRGRILGDSIPLLIHLKVNLVAIWVVTGHCEHSIPRFAHVRIRPLVEVGIVDPIAVIWSGIDDDCSSGAESIFVFNENHALSGFRGLNGVGGYELKILFFVRPRLLLVCGYRISHLTGYSVHTEPIFITLGRIVWLN